MKRTLIPAIIITALASVGLTGLVYSTAMPTGAPNTSTAGPVVAQQVYAKADGDALTPNNIMFETNAYRASQNLPKLATSELLNKAACLKLDDMVANNYWSHDKPDGTTPWTFIEAAGYNYTAAGENLAFGQLTTTQVMNDWINSPKHKENLVNTHWKEQGVCVKFVQFQEREVFLMVHHFGAKL